MLGLGGTEGGGNNNNINNNIISSSSSNGGGSPHVSSAVAPPAPFNMVQQVQEQNGCSSGLERPTPRRGAIPSLDVDPSHTSRPNGGSSHPTSPGAAFQGPSPMVTHRSNNNSKPLLMATGHVKMELGQGALDLNHHGSSRGSELDLNAFGWER
jgi:hypothetical protein